MKKYPYAIIDDTHIASVYDTFPNMIWNGGGSHQGPMLGKADIIELIEFYKNINIPMRLTLTNPTLDQYDILDRYCNSVLDIASDYVDHIEILVSSPILEEHIRTHYPHFVLNHSIIATKNDKTVEEYIEECDLYHHIVLPRRVSKDFDFLNQIPQNLRNKFEFLCTDPCPVNCPNLYSHYEKAGNYQRGADLDKSKIYCTHNYPTLFRHADYKKDQITLPEIANTYEPMGFSEFKISGRGSLSGPISMIDYFFKPDYKTDVYAMVLGNGIIK